MNRIPRSAAAVFHAATTLDSMSVMGAMQANENAQRCAAECSRIVTETRPTHSLQQKLDIIIGLTSIVSHSQRSAKSGHPLQRVWSKRKARRTFRWP